VKTVSPAAKISGGWTVSGGKTGLSPFSSFSPQSALRLTAPNGNEIIQPGTPFPVRWLSNKQFEKVTLDYSPDNGTTYLSIANAIANNGNYLWWVPYHISSNCLVRISSAETTGAVQNALLYEMTFKISYHDAPSTHGETFTIWLGDALSEIVNPFTPGITFSNEADNGTYVRFNETIKEIPQIQGSFDGWHRLKVLVEPGTQSASLWLDETIIFENLRLNPGFTFSPAISFSTGPEDSATIDIDNLTVRISDSTAVENENTFPILFIEDFENFEVGTLPENSGWVTTRTEDPGTVSRCVLVSRDSSTWKNCLKLQVIENNRVVVVKHFTIPGSFPFDTSDKTFSIKESNKD